MVFDGELLKAGENTLVIEMPSPGRPLTRDQNTPHAALLWDAVRLETIK